MVPLGCVGLSAHQHQSTSFSVTQASKLPHHTAALAWPPSADGARPKLASDRASLPNSPIHTGAICSSSRDPPLPPHLLQIRPPGLARRVEPRIVVQAVDHLPRA